MVSGLSTPREATSSVSGASPTACTLTAPEPNQRLLDELLAALEKVLTNEETLAALREKIRKDLPALFNLYRADAYLLRTIVASTSAFLSLAIADL